PVDAEGLDWLAGRGQENLDEFAAAHEGGATLERFLERVGDHLKAVDGPEVHEALGDLVSEVDRQALTGDYADHVATSFHKALAQGIWGWFDDDIAFVRAWGFELGSISVPVAIWQGAQDR